jgi:hypothetical protein
MTLIVKPKTADLTRDVELFGNMVSKNPLRRILMFW